MIRPMRNRPPPLRAATQDQGRKGHLDESQTVFRLKGPKRPSSLPRREDSRPLISFVGRLSFQKGLDVLMDAMDLRQRSGFHLAIAGKGELSGWLEDSTPGPMRRETSPSSDSSRMPRRGGCTRTPTAWSSPRGSRTPHSPARGNACGHPSRDGGCQWSGGTGRGMR